MLRFTLFSLFFVSLATAGDADFNGRWVIEFDRSGPGRVAWLEIWGAGSGMIQGTAVGLQSGGQVDPISAAKIVEGELRFQVERVSGNGAKRRTDISTTRVELAAGKLRGVTNRNGNEMIWTGHPAPKISDRDDGGWVEGRPIVLFDGGDRDAWVTLRQERNGEWSVNDGILINSKGADELMTKEKFWNFRLQVEFRVGEHSNSGVGLRGRYEIQIYDDFGEPADKSGNGALYSRKPADVNASRPAGEWQTFDITLIGRDLTALLNGKKIHDKVDVHGFTAMATDWREDQPGPITLQGDHGIVEFRKIVVTPLKRR